MQLESDIALTRDPSLAAVAGEVRNLAGRAAAAAGELAALAGHPADALEIAEGLQRAAGLLGGLAMIRD